MEHIKSSVKLPGTEKPKFSEYTYKCKECKDTGLLLLTRFNRDKYPEAIAELKAKYNPDDPMEKDKVWSDENIDTYDVAVKCPYCNGVQRQIQGLPSWYMEAGTFNPSIYKNKLEVIEFIKRERKRVTYIGGDNGVGKTMLACLLGNLEVKAGKKVIFITTQDLIKQYIKGMKEERTNTQKYRDVDFLILDDFGAERTTEYAEDEIALLIYHRLAVGKKTIITSNTLVDLLTDKYSRQGKRLKSKLSDGTYVEELFLDADDQRRKR